MSALPFQLAGISGALVRSWSTARTLMGDTLGLSPGTMANTYADGIVTPTTFGSNVFSKGVVTLPNGNVVIIPSGNTGTPIYVYNVSNDTLTAGPIPGISAAFIGGVLLPNGTVLCIPDAAASFYVFDPNAMTLTAVLAHGITPLGTCFLGACVGLDGNVYLIGGSSGHTNYGLIQCYNPTANTLTTVVTISPAPTTATPFTGCTTLPSGKILITGNSYNNNLIFDPVALTATPATGSHSVQSSGIILPSGNVMYVPNATNSIRIFNPTLGTDTVIATLTGLTGTNYFCNGILLQDGQVALVPRDHTNMVIVNPTSGAVTVGASPTNLTLADKYRAAVMLNNGIILAIPNKAANFGKFTVYSGGSYFSANFLSCRFVTHPLGV